MVIEKSSKLRVAQEQRMMSLFVLVRSLFSYAVAITAIRGPVNIITSDHKSNQD